MRCVWIGSSLGSKALGSDPPSGLAHRVGGFPYISCPLSSRGSTRTVHGFSPSGICFELCSETTGKSSLQLRFWTPKHLTIWRLAVQIPPLGIRMLPHQEKSKIHLQLIDDASCLDIAPWTLSAATVRFDLTKFCKYTTNTETYKQCYLQHVSDYPLWENKNKNYWRIRQREEGVAAASVSTNHTLANHTLVGFLITVLFSPGNKELFFRL